jgi:hypothetical protein
MAAISKTFYVEIKRKEASCGSRRSERVAQMFYSRLHLGLIKFRHLAHGCEVL